MKLEKGKKYLITTDNWFRAPDGETYNSVFGTVIDVANPEETLGIKTNARSSNWYVHIGRMIVAGCQIHYVIQCDSVSTRPPKVESVHEGKNVVSEALMSRIYLADLT